MTPIRDWLEGLGLGRFAGAFEDNEIDLAALPHLTEAMLEKLGLPMGPRARALAAIAALEVAPTADTEERPAPGPPDEQPQGERRQITVMFCDMVGSTQLAKRLDPEDLRALMRSYQRACGAAIERYQGHVAQYRGDGIMAYPGWPTAHEDDAERALRAALDILPVVAALESPRPLAVRIGIATGAVVVV